MFIYSIWDHICKDISTKCNTIKVNQILDQSDDTKWIAIKHDVETNVAKALELAKIENKYNLQATYYVQADLVDENYKLLQKIKSLGHEVTYHYDVLDANNGDIDKSIEDFENNLKKFKKYGFDVSTVCPHGNPVMIRDGWSSNKDFFRYEKVTNMYLNILDMVVQLPNKLNYSYTYISDAGYGWKKITNIENNDIKNDGDVEIKDYKELINIINSTDNLILSTHPHRWEKNSFKFIKNVYVFKILRLVARFISKIPILKNIISRYYYLAKKI
jgi:hypothetical protein